MLEYGFMQRALLAGLLLALAGGYLGVFVVQRRMAFLTDGLAHSAFGGVALGLLLGWPPLLLALPGTFAVSLGIVALGRRTRLSNDTAIGVFFATSVALGIVLLSRKQGSTGDAMAYLFGSIVLIGPQELLLAAILFMATLALVPQWGRWALEGCDPELARTDGLRPERSEYVLAGALALVVVASVKLVGAVLAMAFLIVPAATARLWSRTLLGQTLGSVLLAVAAVVLGLWGSYRFDLPSGPAIVLAQAALFFVATIRPRSRGFRRHGDPLGAIGAVDGTDG
ncbi:MAG: metal ABC transporter permease [Armatimonadetes bacterium]|nr:metal ABC transporter permease [Armatimonadota bacterium]MCA1996932.1 metal ABC transporter permease [Armatimonadota bacterium]